MPNAAEALPGNGNDDDVVEPPVPEGTAVTDELYWSRYKKQLAYCGDLCKPDESKYLPLPTRMSVDNFRKAYVSKPVRCASLFSKRAESLFDGAPFEWPPPKNPPILKEYLLKDAKLGSWYFQQRYAGSKALVPEWTEAEIDGYVEQVKQGKLEGS